MITDEQIRTIVAKAESGQYFVATATTIENLCNDPNMTLETLRFILEDLADELHYMQQAYAVTKA